MHFREESVGKTVTHPSVGLHTYMSKNNVSPPKSFRNATPQVSAESRCPSSGGEFTVFRRSVWNPSQTRKPLISCLPHLPSSKYPHSWRILNIQPETTAIRQWKQYVSSRQWVCSSEKTSLEVCPLNQSSISSEGNLLARLLSKQPEVKNHALSSEAPCGKVLVLSWECPPFVGPWHSKHHNLKKVAKAVFLNLTVLLKVRTS